MEGKIELTNVNLVEFVKKVYELSQPVGLGFIHYTPEPLTDEEAKNLIDMDHKIVVSMDYVKGRCCKMAVFQDEDRLLWIDGVWRDHTPEQLEKLLEVCCG